MPIRSTTSPKWVAAHAAAMTAAGENPTRLMAAIQRSPVPTLLVDDQRRYVEANGAARALLGLSLHELRRQRVDDLTPPYLWPVLEQFWARLLETGQLIGDDFAEASYLGVSCYAKANILPGRHMIAFVLPGASGQPAQDGDSPEVRLLTPRELEVLQLAAGGLKGPAIAAQLVLTPATIRTHFANIYRKLDVGDRAAAVAKAMRLGLIS